MAKLVNNLTDLIGDTPLLRPKAFIKREKIINVDLLLKLEYFNPLGSVKDRIAYAMIKDAEERGVLNADSVIIEPSSGNTGIGLAFVAAARGYRIIVVMPDTMSHERRGLVKALGAKLVLTRGVDGVNASIRKAEELKAQLPTGIILQQFNNPTNPRIHYVTTGPEIWRATSGKVDILVCGVGTGGTISGTGGYLKAQKSSIQVVAVEPALSPVLSGGTHSPHKIQGIGAGFIPAVMDMKIVDEVFTVKDEDAFDTVRVLAKTEGLLVGASSGAAAFAAVRIALRPENVGKTILAILPDTGERYLSTALFDYPQDEKNSSE
ncbi:MAG: cysteine synthase A [Fusobacteriaceae bacterium]|jgi:cysteine synthase A|nr:cysteine synthase A [Fusobacteriaceae bacterium]